LALLDALLYPESAAGEKGLFDGEKLLGSHMVEERHFIVGAQFRFFEFHVFLFLSDPGMLLPERGYEFLNILFEHPESWIPELK